MRSATAADLDYWMAAGANDGANDGESDARNGYSADSKPDAQSLEGVAAYAHESFNIAYEAAYESTFERVKQSLWDDGRAQLEGASAGAKQAKLHYPTYDNDASDSHDRDDLLDWVFQVDPTLGAGLDSHAAVQAFDRAYRDAYHQSFNACED